MKRFQHLIIGGGMTGAAAAHGIREVAPGATIGLISADPHPPYNRPPLSKALWKGDPESSVWRTDDVQGVEMILSRRVTAIDAGKRTVTDDKGDTYGFESLLLATGGAPRRLTGAPGSVVYFRTIDDYRRLRVLAAPGKHFVVLGGGFIGSEVAAALRMQGAEVTMVIPEAGVGARVFPAPLSQHLADYYRGKGVAVRTGEGVATVTERAGKSVVKTTTGTELSADCVVAGLGIIPSVELAQSAGLAIENGIVVDEFLRTSTPLIYAAGDVANFPSYALGHRVRVEHEDNANAQGRQAGRNLAGANEPYHHLPFFYGDLFELGYEAVGDLDARLETVSDWKTPFQEGVVYFLGDSRVRGVLLWNTWGQVDHARALIAEPGPFTPASLVGRLPVS
ncbi:MAG TPA: FAD-dependent oxidoreductase [Gemmatimonadales bacterium]|jgi:3-phenylpropionate/trans-cinnamate dioxygenase ferredoxin reductase subunit|nr:FAD-dependent oxidoreductase [Gemmatimonadales bacterium]